MQIPTIEGGPVELHTPRLWMRPWQDADREVFAALNADPVVMRYQRGTLDRQASDRCIDTWLVDFAQRGWSNWAVERRDDGRCIGFVGLTVPWRVLPFTPCVEIGWRLARKFWGCGYASEAAREALRFGFERLGLEEIVSFTAVVNAPSRAVMERIGMHDANEDFDHPAIDEGSLLRRHCLYRLSQERWKAMTAK